MKLIVSKDRLIAIPAEKVESIEIVPTVVGVVQDGENGSRILRVNGKNMAVFDSVEEAKREFEVLVGYLRSCDDEFRVLGKR